MENQQINVNLAEAEDLTCVNEECGCPVFEQAYMIKRISALQSPTGREEIVPVPIMLCKACGQPLKPE